MSIQNMLIIISCQKNKMKNYLLPTYKMFLNKCLENGNNAQGTQKNHYLSFVGTKCFVLQ